MSLPEAILEIAEEMEQCGDEWSSCGFQTYGGVLHSYAKQLRRLIKAAEHTEVRTAVAGSLILPQSDLLKQEEIRRKEMLKHADMEEQLMSSMVDVVGGDHDGTFVPVDNKIPAGAKTLLGKQVYVYREGRFHYSEEETSKLARK